MSDQPAGATGPGPGSRPSGRQNGGQFRNRRRFHTRPTGQEFGPNAPHNFHNQPDYGPPFGTENGPGQPAAAAARSRRPFRPRKKPVPKPADSGPSDALENAPGTASNNAQSCDIRASANRRPVREQGTSSDVRGGPHRHRQGQNASGSRPVPNDVPHPQKVKPADPVKKNPPKRLLVVDDGDPESQRKRLVDLLQREAFECMICCEDISSKQAIWTCFDSCHNLFHLNCISKWACANASESNAASAAGAPAAGNGWRCPACQTTLTKIPNKYFCFCGKKRNPEPQPDLVPHSCGQMCSKRKNSSKTSHCVHRCQLPCHPGPCPPCDIGVSQNCCCGRTSKPIACGASDRQILTCDNVCDKKLSCKKHNCTRTCHPGPCDPCLVEVVQKCFCGRDEQKLKCESGLPDEILPHCCGNKCHKKLSCGHHLCKDLCHSGPCPDCRFEPGVVDSCPCGKTPISSFTDQERSKCTDPLPVCAAECGKTLRCGPLAEPHKCMKTCHNGTCGPCKLKTSIQCQCAATKETIECKQLKERTFICSRRCNKKLSCGRHKCQKSCCKKDEGHVCTMICQKKLSCGYHKCAEVCHPGPCQPCWNVSWQELTCTCGGEVVYPPIKCGTKVPACNRPCNRAHACAHPVDHTCHQSDSCPPCTYGTTRSCFGNHMIMNNVLCCLPGVSCGRLCGKQMACGVHVCQRACHAGTCGDCNYSCTKIRPCGHLCNQTCHALTSDSCPSVPCRVMLTVYCFCKRLSDKRTCDEINHQNHRLPMTLLARLKISNDSELDVSALIREGEVHKFVRLECDAKCLQIERNRNLADALSISNADVNPDSFRYSESLKQAYMHYPDFVRETYTTIAQLVKSIEKSRNNFAFHNFSAMRSDLRQIIHELAEVFKCKSHSEEQEPNRKVVVKAIREKSAVPAQSIMDVMRNRLPAKSAANFTTLVKSTQSTAPKPAAVVEKKDYFDFDGDE